mmetsp:Transcript_8471/g.12812  ORF Transcript_8471/g.12812 Transcript_8471/m.12812 type:complete len:326 (+) Transcript_8471:60-1037(+)
MYYRNIVIQKVISLFAVAPRHTAAVQPKPLSWCCSFFLVIVIQFSLIHITIEILNMFSSIRMAKNKSKKLRTRMLGIVEHLRRLEMLPAITVPLTWIIIAEDDTASQNHRNHRCPGFISSFEDIEFFAVFFKQVKKNKFNHIINFLSKKFLFSESTSVLVHKMRCYPHIIHCTPKPIPKIYNCLTILFSNLSVTIFYYCLHSFFNIHSFFRTICITVSKLFRDDIAVRCKFYPCLQQLLNNFRFIFLNTLRQKFLHCFCVLFSGFIYHQSSQFLWDTLFITVFVKKIKSLVIPFHGHPHHNVSRLLLSFYKCKNPFHHQLIFNQI